MDLLFDPARHEPLRGIAWDAAAARGWIEGTVADIRAAFTPAGLWPLHPSDASPSNVGPQTDLYFGAAGVVWALDHLAREGAAPPGPSFAEHLDEVQRRNRALLDSEAWHAAMGAAWQTRSWLLGDAGIQFLQHKIAPSAELAAALAATIAANTDDPALELMWGAPGTMLAALALYRAGGEARWAELFRAGAAALSAQFAFDDEIGADLWVQFSYGTKVRYLGAVHGFAGNAFALNQGRDLLEPTAWQALATRLGRTVAATALRGEHGVNWPAFVGKRRPGVPHFVQHCHGAPGMVTSLALLDTVDDALLCGGGALTWTAGPVAKGSNLCHGTAGNGFAFLKLFQRTGDELWLYRARAFAMHAISQSDAEAATVGRRRYALWTGDPGLACFIWECLRATARFPTMDAL